jgi:hypothetical protein
MRRILDSIVLVIVLVAGSLVFAAPLKLADVDEVYPEVPQWLGARILHIGDSHVSAGFRSGLARRLKQAGAVYWPHCWVGSRSKSWIVSGRFRGLLRKHLPDVVVITSGTNMMSSHRPGRHAGWVQALIQRVGGRSCYWIGPPPLLSDEHGLNEMLESNSGDCRYFDSRVLDIEARDNGKFHLTRSQGEDWAELVWRWMNGDYLPQVTEPPIAL